MLLGTYLKIAARTPSPHFDFLSSPSAPCVDQDLILKLASASTDKFVSALSEPVLIARCHRVKVRAAATSIAFSRLMKRVNSKTSADSQMLHIHTRSITPRITALRRENPGKPHLGLSAASAGRKGRVQGFRERLARLPWLFSISLGR